MVAQLVKKSPIYEAFRQNEGLFLEVIQDAAFESARRMGEKASEIYSIKNRSLCDGDQKAA